jgi:hypothetical protein
MSWLQAISNRITHIKNQTTLKLMSLLSTRMSWLQAISNRITHIKKQTTFKLMSLLSTRMSWFKQNPRIDRHFLTKKKWSLCHSKQSTSEGETT